MATKKKEKSTTYVVSGIIRQSDGKSIQDIYGLSEVTIPSGYEYEDFRCPLPKDIVLTVNHTVEVADYKWTNPRIILRKTKKIRITIEAEYDRDLFGLNGRDTTISIGMLGAGVFYIGDGTYTSRKLGKIKVEEV